MIRKFYFTLLFVLSSITCSPLYADGAWTRVERIDPMSDELTVYYTIESDTPIQCSLGNAIPKIYFTCKENALAILEAENCIFVEKKLFSYRVDKEDRSFLSTNPRPSGSTVQLQDFLNSEPIVPKFVNELLNGKQLLIEISPYGAEDKIVRFDIEGLAKTLTADFQACASPKIDSNEVAKSEKPTDTNLPEVQLGPRIRISLEDQIIEQLVCRAPPKPTDIFEALRKEGKISYENNEGFDSLSCFRISGAGV